MNVLTILILVSSTLRIAAGMPSGNYYRVAQFLKYIIEHPNVLGFGQKDSLYIPKALLDTNGIEVQIDTTGGSRHIMDMLMSDTVEYHIGIAQSDIVYQDLYINHPSAQNKIFVIAILFDEALHLIFYAENPRQGPPNISTVSKIVSLGMNSGSYYTVRRIVPALNTYDPKFVLVNNPGEILDYLRQNPNPNVLGALIIAPPWENLENNLGKFKFAALRKEEVRTLLQKRSFRFIKEFEITKRHYSNLSHPVNTVGVSALLVVNTDNLLKIFPDNVDKDSTDRKNSAKKDSLTELNKFITFLLRGLLYLEDGKIVVCKAPNGEIVVRRNTAYEDTIHSDTIMCIDTTLKMLISGFADRNTHPQILTNWSDVALDFWGTFKPIKSIFIIAFMFLIALSFIAAASRRWKLLVLKWIKLVDETEEGEIVYTAYTIYITEKLRDLAEKLKNALVRILSILKLKGSKKGGSYHQARDSEDDRGLKITISGKFIEDFLTIFMFVAASLFIGFMFLYAGHVTNLSEVSSYILWGIVGVALAVVLAKSLSYRDYEDKSVPWYMGGFSLIFIVTILIVGVMSEVYKSKGVIPYRDAWLMNIEFAISMLIFPAAVMLSYQKRDINILRGGSFLIILLAFIRVSTFKGMSWSVALWSAFGLLFASLVIAWVFRGVRKRKGIYAEILFLLVVLLFVWVWGSFFLYYIEKFRNINFDNLMESLWSVVVYLFSGLEDRGPLTLSGRILASLVIFLGSIMVLSTFTAILSSFFTERRLKVGGLVMQDYSDHIIIINWNTRGEKVLKELIKSPLGKKASKIVVFTPNPLPEPEIQKFEEFDCRLTFLSGNILSKTTLKAIDVDKARAVIVLADDKKSEKDKNVDDPDAYTSLVILSIGAALKEIEQDKKGKEGKREAESSESEHGKKKRRPMIIAEAINSSRRELIKQAGADIVVCSEDFEGGLIVQSANYPKLFEVYNQLLKYSEDTNEFYMIELKTIKEENEALFKELCGKKFNQIIEVMREWSPDDNPTLVVGLKKFDTGTKDGGKTQGEWKLLLNPRDEKKENKEEKNKNIKLPDCEDEEGIKNYSLIVMAYRNPNIKAFKPKTQDQEEQTQEEQKQA